MTHYSIKNSPCLSSSSPGGLCNRGGGGPLMGIIWAGGRNGGLGPRGGGGYLSYELGDLLSRGGGGGLIP